MLEWDEKESERLKAEAGTLKGGEGGDDGLDAAPSQFVAYVPLPDIKAIEQLVVERKKQELLSKYSSASLLREQEEAKSLLNKK